MRVCVPAPTTHAHGERLIRRCQPRDVCAVSTYKCGIATRVHELVERVAAGTALQPLAAERGGAGVETAAVDPIASDDRAAACACSALAPPVARSLRLELA